MTKLVTADSSGWTIKNGIENLFPGYFAMVMATGIVAIACFFEGFQTLAYGLSILNMAVYAILVGLLSIRIVVFPKRVAADALDHGKGPGFFTIPAGSCVLGSQFVILHGLYQPAAVLWLVGLLTWVLVTYTFFAAVTTREVKPTIEQGLSGTWLLAAVSTQSVSVLGTLLAPHFADQSELILFFTLSMFLIGCMLYLMLIILIFYRFTFVDLTSERLTPPYWINMGAVAIATLAGSRLIIAAGTSPFLGDVEPFLKGFTIFFWASGTWWIPLLFILGLWRHVYMRHPLKYDPQYWGLVFPLGMYTVCTIQLSKAIGFEPLTIIPSVFIYFALAAWLATAIGFVWEWIPKRSQNQAI